MKLKTRRIIRKKPILKKTKRWIYHKLTFSDDTILELKKICENENSQTQQTHTPNRKKNNGLDVISNDWNKFMLTEKITTKNNAFKHIMNDDDSRREINREKNLII